MQRMRERYLVDEEGKRIAVVLPIEDYERLLEELEELVVRHTCFDGLADRARHRSTSSGGPDCQPSPPVVLGVAEH